ncbi:NRAMP family divalent metal transporter [Sulfuracidifex tepidarius]|uniref:Divalent metal cation transporter MntH n=2 Tax=Sulfuracidifex tepidarius TaxID=1294262 RepID=A0A510DZ04_9CREN|nr:divalent metal cation transporter [Sulfuracidifex tepidarius]BBG25464.1 Divalent metal cation transporter MntH [Sulfuracidifex tepidarius]
MSIKGVFRSWGPAWLVMIADMDAASLITAAQNGVQYGYGLIWFLLLLVVPLYMVQEVSGRIGIATGKGLAEILRENMGPKVALLSAMPMATIDFLSYAAEYTGIAVGMEMVGISPLVSVPIAYLLHLFLVYKREYMRVEKYLIAGSIIMIAIYILAALFRGFDPYSSPFLFSTSKSFIFLAAANIGAVVMPFMLFYQASATAEKRIHNVKAMRIETFVGALVSELLMVAIEVASTGLKNANFQDPSVISSSLSSIAGPYSPLVFGMALVLSGFIALVIISLGSAWGVTEALGIGRRNWFKVYLAESLPAALIPIISDSLINVVLNLMVFEVLALVFPIVLMGFIASNKNLMGEHATSKRGMVVYWVIVSLIILGGLLALI